MWGAALGLLFATSGFLLHDRTLAGTAIGSSALLLLLGIAAGALA